MKIINDLIKKGYKITFAKDDINPDSIFIDMRKDQKRKYTSISFKMINSFPDAIESTIETLVNKIEKIK